MIDLFCLYFQLVIAPALAGPVMVGQQAEYFEARTALCGTTSTVDPNFGT